MAKEFDIYLNKRLTECDIIVYSIPFRDGLTATNRMILESCLESYTLQKFIAVETGSELVSHIDKMIKTCNERLHMASTWGIDLEFQTHYVLNPVPTVIEIAPNDDLQTLRNMFMSVEDKLQITAASIDAMVAKSLGEGGSRMNIDAEVRQSLKNSLLRPAAALPVDTKVRQISEQNFLTIDAPVEPSAEIVDLCYRFYTAAGTAMQIAAAVTETEIHFSLGIAEPRYQKNRRRCCQHCFGRSWSTAWCRAKSGRNDCVSVCTGQLYQMPTLYQVRRSLHGRLLRHCSA